MRICIVAEGCYPYVVGGVSSWIHSMIKIFPEYQFVVLAIVANRSLRGKFVYDLPENVVEVHELYLEDADWRPKELKRAARLKLNEREYAALRSLLMNQNVDWDTLFSFFGEKEFSLNELLMGEDFFRAVQECYTVLGIIHEMYTPMPGRFKDYIAMPKVNMYQSLHTTIVAEDGNIFEVQIRTEAMDAVAEQGIAAHWRYKENINGGREVHQKEIEEQLHWFKDFSVMSDEVNDDAMEYMNLLQKDIFEANVYVMTPKGKVIALPNGSTPIDFAYRVHTEVGHHTVGATINGVLMPLNTKLKTGDVVNIRTSKQSPGPSEDWIKVVKSAHARNKIRSFFQKQESERRSMDIKKGEELLVEELKRRNLDADTYTEQKKLESIAGSLSFNSYQDLMYAIGVKQVSLPSVIDRLVKHKTSVPLDNEELAKMFNRQERKKKPSATGIRIAGIESMKISLAACCAPVPGDEIIGYITKGAGVKVHRADCPNIINEKQRLIPVEWDENIEQKTYEVKLIVKSTDRNFLLSDIVTVVSQCKAGLQHVDSTVEEDRISATTKMTVVVENSEHLRSLMANLQKVNSVKSVERVIQ